MLINPPILTAATPAAVPASVPIHAPESTYYERHIFFCTNQRGEGKDSCANHGAQDAAAHCKQAVKAAHLSGPGKVRVNQAGCLDRCAAGPVCVVYPEAVWYTYVDTQDIDEIVDSHLKNGVVVQRLLTLAHIGK